MNCLITGANGFVGKYLVSELKNTFHKIYRSGLENSIEIDPDLLPIDIRNEKSVNSLIQSIQPDVIFHLAAQASVPISIENPQETLEINVKGTINILSSMKNLNKSTKLIYISSADVYGKQEEKSYPLNETILPNPVNPYSSSKLSAEIFCRQFALQYENLQIIIARPFNHIGVGQREIFVVPSFIKQVLEAKKTKKEIIVGNLSSKRDFLDVRDVVRAYSILAERGKSGEIYNICSGEDISIQEILDKIIQITNANIEISVDPARFRKADTPRLFGTSEKLQKLGWSKKFDIEQSLKDIIESYH